MSDSIATSEPTPETSAWHSEQKGPSREPSVKPHKDDPTKGVTIGTHPKEVHELFPIGFTPSVIKSVPSYRLWTLLSTMEPDLRSLQPTTYVKLTSDYSLPCPYFATTPQPASS